MSELIAPMHFQLSVIDDPKLRKRSSRSDEYFNAREDSFGAPHIQTLRAAPYITTCKMQIGVP